MKIREAFIKRQIPILIAMGIIMFILLILPISTKRDVSINGEYRSKDSVSLYLMKYHELPKNYITEYGRKKSSNATSDTQDLIIGGDTHWNDGKLKSFGISNDATLKECDIYFEGYSNGISQAPVRGELRLVYTANTKHVRVFYTTDHYDTFTEITRYDIMPAHYITKYIMIGYIILGSIAIGFVYAPAVREKIRRRLLFDNNQ